MSKLFQNAKIDSIKIELPNYDFEHSPSENDESKRWIARRVIEDKLKGFLTSKQNSGAYLITGYRGMGKTSFVKRVIKGCEENSNESGKKFKKVEINFGQKDINELDILRQILKGLKDKLVETWLKNLHEFYFSFKAIPVYTAFLFLVFTFLIPPREFAPFLSLIKKDNSVTKDNQLLKVDERLPINDNGLIKSTELKICTDCDRQTNNLDVSTLILNLSIALGVTFILIVFLQWLLKKSFRELYQLNKLNDLYDRCRSEITQESGNEGANEKFPLKIGDKATKKFPIANPKEVENEILEILSEINNLNESRVGMNYSRLALYLFLGISFSLLVLLSAIVFSFSYSYIYTKIGIGEDCSPPIILSLLAVTFASYFIYNFIRNLYKEYHKRELRFIFILDEIDKIDPVVSTEFYHQELSAFEKQNRINKSYDFRERKKAVISVLASLKYLITSAKAKFIFIAGREMFDASLADIADRQSSLGSIFNAVINVDSFLKNDKLDYTSDDRTSTVSGAIEEYLEKLLLTPDERKMNSGEPFLKKYYKFISNISQSLNDSQKVKVIYTLQHLITYLTYRSNGAPKKLSRLIEEFIEEEGEIVSTAERALVVKRNNEKAVKVLNFNYHNQYKIGYINYLIRPFLISYGPYFKRYSDRILFSIPFLIDHIFKFHPFAFSIQNLELIPEVVSETRNPELRNFIHDLVNFYSQNHIRETEIGLFEYKFFNKTFNEMTYLCKLFEEESAAFNFTLDETYHVKQHIRNKIKELRSIHKEFLREENIEDIKSISFLNEMVGDAQYFDQEFDESVGSYLDALQKMEPKKMILIQRDWNNESFNITDFVSYIRLKLKLGLIYERMKNYESALFTYIQASEVILNSIRIENDMKDYSFPSLSDMMQLFIQPFLAEMYLLEKYSVDGVTWPKLIVSQNKITRLFNSILCHSNTIILSNYFSGLGTLLYYKNFSAIQNNQSEYFKANATPVKLLLDHFNPESVVEVNLFKKFFNDPETKKLKRIQNDLDYRYDTTHYCYYKTSLYLLMQPYLKESTNDTPIGLIELLVDVENIITPLINESYLHKRFYNSRKKDYNKSFFKNISIALSKFGDSLLSSLQLKEHINLTPKFISFSKDKYFEGEENLKEEYWTFYKFKNGFDLADDENRFELILCLYFWSSQFAFRCGRNISLSFQYRKIMLVCNRFLSPNSLIQMEGIYRNYFFKNIIRIAGWNSNTSERFQIYKYKNYFGIETFFHPLDKSMFNYANISNSPEVKEALLLYADFMLKTARTQFGKNRALLKTKYLVTSDNTVSTQYVRTLELIFKEKFNRELINKLKHKRILDKFCEFENNGFWYNYMKAALIYRFPEVNNEEEFKKLIGQIAPDDLKDLLKDLVAITSDSFFCLHNVISIFNGFGIDYFITYTSLANQHNKLGYWLKYVEFCKLLKDFLCKLNFLSSKESENSEYNIQSNLDKLIGKDILKTTDTVAQYHLALQNYARAKQLHNEGLPYKTFLANMYYLEDDYNDGLFHFSIALERVSINTGKNRKYISKLDKEVRASQIYDTQSYF